MGSKAYNPKKIERQTNKMSNSTSLVQGFRINGMQVNDTFYNKYWGRAVKNEDIEQSIALFFRHGDQMRVREIEEIAR